MQCPNTKFFSGPNAGKYGPEKTPHLDNFHAVQLTFLILKNTISSTHFILLVCFCNSQKYLEEVQKETVCRKCINRLEKGTNK